MSSRKYPPGHLKRKRAQQILALTQSLAGSLNKYLTPNTQDGSSEEFTNLLNENENNDTNENMSENNNER